MRCGDPNLKWPRLLKRFIDDGFENFMHIAYIDSTDLGLVLRNSQMSFYKEYFEQIFGIIMGTNIAPILANIYMALLENE